VFVMGAAASTSLAARRAVARRRRRAVARRRRRAVGSPSLAAVEPSLAATLATLAADPAMADRVLAIFGADTDGHITLEQLTELVTEYLMARDGWCKEEDVKKLFKALDADADGRLTRADVCMHGASNVDGKPPLLWLKALTPPPSGVAAFAELVRPGGPVAIDGAEYRAMSLGQLKATLKHAQRRCQAEGWLGVRFPGGEMRHERLDPEAINLYDVATHVILPATYGHLLPDGKTKPSFVELVADGMQRPDYFIRRRLHDDGPALRRKGRGVHLWRLRVCGRHTGLAFCSREDVEAQTPRVMVHFADWGMEIHTGVLDPMVHAGLLDFDALDPIKGSKSEAWGGD
jgi:hypothetical protein